MCLENRSDQLQRYVVAQVRKHCMGDQSHASLFLFGITEDSLGLKRVRVTSVCRDTLAPERLDVGVCISIPADIFL
jgi:hypothetical protein